MKKIFLFFAIIFATTISASALQLKGTISKTINQNAISIALAFQGEGSFDYTYDMGGCVVWMRGTITSWDINGPHGDRTITIIWPDGSTTEWSEPYNYKVPGDQRTIALDRQYPDLEEMFFNDISVLH